MSIVDEIDKLNPESNGRSKNIKEAITKWAEYATGISVEARNIEDALESFVPIENKVILSQFIDMTSGAEFFTPEDPTYADSLKEVYDQNIIHAFFSIDGLVVAAGSVDTVYNIEEHDPEKAPMGYAIISGQTPQNKTIEIHFTVLDKTYEIMLYHDRFTVTTDNSQITQSNNVHIEVRYEAL